MGEIDMDNFIQRNTAFVENYQKKTGKQLGTIIILEYDKQKKTISCVFINPLTGKRNRKVLVRDFKEEPSFLHQFYANGHFYALFRTNKYLYSVYDGKITKMLFRGIDDVANREQVYYLPYFWYSKSNGENVLMHYSGQPVFTVPKDYAVDNFRSPQLINKYPVFFIDEKGSNNKNRKRLILDPFRKQVFKYGDNETVAIANNKLLAVKKDQAGYHFRVYKNGIKKNNVVMNFTLDKKNIPDIDISTETGISFNEEGLITLYSKDNLYVFAMDPSYKKVNFVTAIYKKQSGREDPDTSVFNILSSYSNGNIVFFTGYYVGKNPEKNATYIFKRKNSKMELVEKLVSDEHWDGETKFLGDNDKYIFMKYKYKVVGIEKKTGKLVLFNNLHFPDHAVQQTSLDPSKVHYYDDGDLYRFDPKTVTLRKDKLYLNDVYYLSNKLIIGTFQSSNDKVVSPVAKVEPVKSGFYFICIEKGKPKIVYHANTMNLSFMSTLSIENKEYLLESFDYYPHGSEDKVGMRPVHWVLMTPGGKVVSESQFVVTGDSYLYSEVVGQLHALFEKMDNPELKINTKQNEELSL